MSHVKVVKVSVFIKQKKKKQLSVVLQKWVKLELKE